VLHDIHRTQNEDFSGALSLLYAGDRMIAGHFGMRSDSVWHYWFPAYDAMLAKYSPGIVLLLKMIEHACEAGISTIDLGKGMSPYKKRFMNAQVDVSSGSVELPSWVYFKRTARRSARGLLVNLGLHKPAQRMIGR
jgi:CelD/BcsL family acetyltransferase involved in cellulose biosynthesis